jgi:hypothetical protein
VKNSFHISILNEQEWRSWYSDYAMGWTVRGSNPAGKDSFIASPEGTDLLRETTRDLFNRHRGYFRGKSGWELKLPTHLYLVTQLRMNGAMPAFPPRVFTTWTRKTKFCVFVSRISIFHALRFIILHTGTHNTRKPFTCIVISVYLYIFTYFYT